jgi:hypothetical protein
MIEWVGNVLAAALIAFLLNTVYQSKRDLERSAAQLIAAVDAYWSENDLIAIHYIQATCGLASYRDTVQHFTNIGIPDRRTLSALRVLVETERPEYETQLNLLLEGGVKVRDQGLKLYERSLSHGGPSCLFRDGNIMEELARARELLESRSKAFKSDVRLQSLNAGWWQALKHAL